MLLSLLSRSREHVARSMEQRLRHFPAVLRKRSSTVQLAARGSLPCPAASARSGQIAAPKLNPGCWPLPSPAFASQCAAGTQICLACQSRNDGRQKFSICRTKTIWSHSAAQTIYGEDFPRCTKANYQLNAECAAVCSALVVGTKRLRMSEEVKRVYPAAALHTTVPPHHHSILPKFEGCGLHRGKERSFIAPPRMLEALQEKVQLRSKRG